MKIILFGKMLIFCPPFHFKTVPFIRPKTYVKSFITSIQEKSRVLTVGYGGYFRDKAVLPCPTVLQFKTGVLFIFKTQKIRHLFLSLRRLQLPAQFNWYNLFRSSFLWKACIFLVYRTRPPSRLGKSPVSWQLGRYGDFVPGFAKEFLNLIRNFSSHFD